MPRSSAIVVFFAIIAWGPNAGNRRLIGVVILATLLLLGLEVWRRQAIREFPERPDLPVAEAAVADDDGSDKAPALGT